MAEENFLAWQFFQFKAFMITIRIRLLYLQEKVSAFSTCRFLDSVFTFKSVIFAVMVGARARNKGNNGIAHSVIIGLVRLGKQFCSVKKGHQIQPAVCKCGQIVKNAFKPHNSVIGQVTNYMNKILFTHQLITSQFINNRYGIMEKTGRQSGYMIMRIPLRNFPSIFSPFSAEAEGIDCCLKVEL